MDVARKGKMRHDRKKFITKCSKGKPDMVRRFLGPVDCFMTMWDIDLD